MAYTLTTEVRKAGRAAAASRRKPAPKPAPRPSPRPTPAPQPVAFQPRTPLLPVSNYPIQPVPTTPAERSTARARAGHRRTWEANVTVRSGVNVQNRTPILAKSDVAAQRASDLLDAQVKDVRRGLKTAGATRTPDKTFILGLPPAAQQDIMGTTGQARTAVKLAKGNPTVLSLGNLEDSAQAASDILDNPKRYVAQQAREKIGDYRKKVADIKKQAPGLAAVASSASGKEVKPETIVKQQVAKLGQPEETVFTRAGKLVNAPFSAAGNVLEGKVGEAGKNLYTLGQGGRQSSVGQGLQKIGVLPKGEDFKAAADFIAPLLIAPGLEGLGSAAGKSALREGEGMALRSLATENAGKSVFSGVKDYSTFIGMAKKEAAAEQKASKAANIGVRVKDPFTGKFGVNVRVLPKGISQRIRANPKLQELKEGVRREFVTRHAAAGGSRPMEAAVRAGQFVGEGRKMHLKREILGDYAFKRLTDEQAKAVTLHMADIQRSGDPVIIAAAKRARQMLDDIYDEATGAGVKLPYRRDYVPDIVDQKLLQRLKGKAGAKSAPVGGGATKLKHAQEQHLGIKGAIERGLNPELDIRQILWKRGNAHIDQMTTTETLKAAAEEGGKVEKGAAPPKDWVALEPPWKIRGVKRVYVPSDVAETLRTTAPMFGERSVPGQLLMTATGKFKKAKLATPAYDLRNEYSDIAAQLQEGYLPYSRGAGRVQAGSKKMVPGTKGMTGEQVRYLMERAGVYSGQFRTEIKPGASTQTAEKLSGKSKVRPFRAYGKFRVARENNPRINTALAEYKRSGSMLHAARRSHDVHFDYSDPGRTIEQIRRLGVIPFITWPAKNLPAQVRRLAQRPGQVAALYNLQQGLQQIAGNPSWATLQPYQQEDIQLPIPKVDRFAALQAPQSDINRYLGSNALSNVVSSLNPAITAPFAVTGARFPGTKRDIKESVQRQWYSGAKLPLVNEPAPIPFLDQVFPPRGVATTYDEKGNPHTERGTSGIADYLARTVLPTALGSTVQQADQGDIARAFLGISSKPFPKTQKQLSGLAAGAAVAVKDAKDKMYSERYKLAQAVKRGDLTREEAKADFEVFAAKVLKALQHQKDVAAYLRQFPKG